MHLIDTIEFLIEPNFTLRMKERPLEQIQSAEEKKKATELNNRKEIEIQKRDSNIPTYFLVYPL